MLKNYDIILTDKISLHFGGEELFYLIPTIGFRKLDWRKITKDNKITYLFVIKWLNWSAGINIQNKIINKKEEILKKWEESGILNDLKHTNKKFSIFKAIEKQTIQKNTLEESDLDEQTKLLDEAYDNYHNYFLGCDDIPTKELFVFECKTDSDFSKKWGLKIEDRELSLKERYNIWFNNNYETGMERYFDPNKIPNFDDQYYTSTPTKLITITYNNETLESYE
jgi:hypothetical protein